MLALRLVRLIESNSEELADSILLRLQASPRTADLQKVSAEELRGRIRDVLLHLGDWLLQKSERDIERTYTQLGARRASQEVAIADLCWAFTIVKERLWEFLSQQGFLQGPLEIYGELELLRLLDQFFDHATCYMAEGYESPDFEPVASLQKMSERDHDRLRT
jgi:hypothetical protein